MTRILVFQHHPLEHPGTFRDFLAADGIAWDVVRLDAGEAIPPLAGYAALVVMGGPQDVWEEDRFPWLVAEKAAIREAVVAREIPYLGVCLGHQLLAVALGGEVAAMAGQGRDRHRPKSSSRPKASATRSSADKALAWHACNGMPPR